ncbi:MAG: hypothetical protein GX417_07690 [Clostridiales bacterium]|nr:hypothetical protein [Clostridiales bacterium]
MRIVWMVLGSLCGLWLLGEIVVRIVCDLPVRTDFYGSIPRGGIAALQKRVGIRVNPGDTYIHLGWIADPKQDRYTVWRQGQDGRFRRLGRTRYGSFLVRNLLPDTTYTFRVSSVSGAVEETLFARTLEARSHESYRPVIEGGWHTLFHPREHGDYLNDHAIYQSGDGRWHIVGITAFGSGDFSKERYFAHGVGDAFPFQNDRTMTELPPVADQGRLAWAPCVVRANDQYYMWYSPHTAYCQTSPGGSTWQERPELAFRPAFAQFRDPMVLQVGQGQWLMYATARHGLFSAVDIYQSFDAERWQYIRSALRTGLGCERAAPQGSTESPFVFEYAGGYYLSVTYNNDSFFFDAMLLPLKVWRDKESYNDTLVFSSGNPYDFGTYRGRKRPSSLVVTLRAHAPEYIEHDGRWYLTSCGWPWVASVTHGEAAWAELRFERQERRKQRSEP